jgi:hypothetical protein
MRARPWHNRIYDRSRVTVYAGAFRQSPPQIPNQVGRLYRPGRELIGLNLRRCQTRAFPAALSGLQETAQVLRRDAWLNDDIRPSCPEIETETGAWQGVLAPTGKASWRL